MRLIASTAVALHDAAEELVIFDRRDGSYHALNPVGSTIWREITVGIEPAAIVERLAARHGVPRERIAQDVEAFVAEALEKGLLVKDSDPA